MRLIDADKLKSIIIEGHRKEFFGSVLWNILDDMPTVTKAEICKEFCEKLDEKWKINLSELMDSVIAEMEALEE